MQPELFATPPDLTAPLAARLRPRHLDEFVGQEHLLGAGKALRRAITAGQLGSIVLWGPPGTGKTSLAVLIVRELGLTAQMLSAVAAGVAELRKAIEAARSLRPKGRRLAMIVDEVHRWSKSQQDALLPAVESGLLTLIGLTSENPYFDLVPALRSRVRIFRLEPLTADDIRRILDRALTDPERGLGLMRLGADDAALDLLVATSGGDARIALNGLEAAASIVSQPARAGGDAGLPLEPRITVAAVEEAIQRRQVRYDRAGDDHYQTISAFIKSIRGSDADAAIFWLAKMLHAGADPRFIARRLVIASSEDIGNADPQALLIATAAYQAVERVGMPEAHYILAQATTYLATAPKSNAAKAAIGKAEAVVAAGANLEVPLHLRNASFAGARGLGYGRDYEYSHDFDPDDPARYRQRYLPDGVDEVFYEPSESGYEAELKRRVARLRALRRQA